MWFALRKALREGKITEEVKRLIKDPMMDFNGRNAEFSFRRAVEFGHDSVVQFFLEHGTKPDIKSSIIERTPLLRACAMGHFDIQRMLLNFGANIHAKGRNFDETVLHLICASDRYKKRGETVKSLQLMIAHGAEIDVKDKADKTPIDKASDLGKNDAVQMLTNFQKKITIDPESLQNGD